MIGQQVYDENKREKTEVVREAHRAKVLPGGGFPAKAGNADARLIEDVRP